MKHEKLMCKTHFYINRKEEAEKKAKMEIEIQKLTNLLTENVQKNKNMKTEIKKQKQTS